MLANTLALHRPLPLAAAGDPSFPSDVVRGSPWLVPTAGGGELLFDQN